MKHNLHQKLMGNDQEIEFHEIEIGIFQLFCKIDQEIEKALGGHYFRLFSQT
jgi:hypothetical protein